MFYGRAKFCAYYDQVNGSQRSRISSISAMLPLSAINVLRLLFIVGIQTELESAPTLLLDGDLEALAVAFRSPVSFIAVI